MFPYFCPMRPPAPGTIPTRGLEIVVPYEERLYAKLIDRMVWGWVGYNRPLSPSEVDEYELISAPRIDLGEGGDSSLIFP